MAFCARGVIFLEKVAFTVHGHAGLKHRSFEEERVLNGTGECNVFRLRGGYGLEGLFV